MARYFPTINTPTKSLVIADMRNDRMDGQIAACVLQGLVNRDSEEKIYVHHTYCADNRGDWAKPRTESYRMVHVAEQWLSEVYSDIPQIILSASDDADCPMFFTLLQKYVAFAKGVIIFDPKLEQATIEMATTIAGQKDGIVVSPALYESMLQKGYNLPVIEDLRKYSFTDNLHCLKVLKEKWFAGANKQVAFTWSHMTLDEKSWGAANKDYVVANKLFTFFLEIHDENEREHYKDIILEYPAGTPIMGWTDELVADQFFAKLGYMMIPYISVENLTISSSFPQSKIEKEEVKDIPLEKDAVYMVLQVADGDNLEHSLVYEPYTIRKDENFGKVPATWILNPAMCELAPRQIRWHTDVLRSAGQEAGAMFADGSPQSERYAGFINYCRIVKYCMDECGMVSMKQMLDAEPVSWNIKPCTILGGYAGEDYRGIGAYEYHLDDETFHIGTRPIDKFDYVPLINNAPKGQPLFISVYCGTATRKVSTDMYNFAENLKKQMPDKKFYFITAAQAAKLYKSI